jgi:hypothetical protein
MQQYDDVRRRGGIGGCVDPAANRKAVVSAGNVTNSDSVISDEIFKNCHVHVNAAIVLLIRNGDYVRRPCAGKL